MMLRRKSLAGAVIALMALEFSGCGESSGKKEAAPKEVSFADGEARLRVVASNYPMKYFTERIGGDAVAVVLLAPADEDPAFWEPTAEDVKQMQQADLIVLNGATYEKWLPTVTLAESKIVNTADGFRDEWLTLAATTTHSHGPAGEHSHTGTDFSTWLDPLLATQQAKAIQEALADRRPINSEKFEANFTALSNDLQELHQQLLAAAAVHGEEPLVASHPVYGYFARRYELNLKPVLWEPETMPTEEQWEELKKLLEAHPAKIMLWEGEPAEEIESRLQGHGVTGTPIIPAGNVPEEGDYLSVWRANAERLGKAK